MKLLYRIGILFLMLISCQYLTANDISEESIIAKVDLAIALQPSNPDSALQLGYEIMKDSRTIGYTEGIGYASVRIGSILHLKGEIDSAIHYLQQAFEIRKKLDNKVGAASIKRYLGIILKQTGQIDSAFSAYYESIRILEEVNDSKALVGSYLELAHMLVDYKEYESAKEYYDKSFNLSISLNDSSTQSYCYEGFGRFYFSQKDYTAALENYLKASQLQDDLGKTSELSITLQNIASCYSELDNYELANTFYKNALELNQDLKFKGRVSKIYQNIGSNYFNMDELDSAISYYDKAIILDEELGDIKGLSKVYLELSKAHRLNGNYLQAYEFHQEHTVLKDSLLNAEKISSISEMQTKYETEKKEQQIVLLDEQNKTKEAQRNFLLAAAGALLLFLFVLGFYYVQRNRLANKNEEIAQQKIESLLDEQEIKTYNAMLEGQEEERMRIATDLHDRLGSMLSTVKLLFSALDDKIDQKETENQQQYEKANHLLDEACVEVRRISHNLGTGMVANFGLFRAVEELCESIDQSGKMKCTLLAYGLEDSKLKLNVEVGIYRMVQEVFNNAIKHSKARKLNIQLNVVEDSLNITIEDDGVGFDLAKVEAKDGMGLGNLHKRAEKLGGSVHIDSQKGRGTTTIIDLPLNEAA